MGTTWTEITYRGQSLKMAVVESHSSKFEGASRFGKKDGRGHVVLLKGDEVLFHNRPSDPRSIGVSDNGRVVIADWIEYGKSTGADIDVLDRDGNQIYHRHIEGSSPLVDISPDGRYVVFCPYGEPAYVDDVETQEAIARHQYEVADRFSPQFVESDQQPEIELSQSDDSPSLYRIDLHGNITWHSEDFEVRQYYDVLSFDETVSWEPAVEKCATDYQETDDDKLRNIIVNTIGDARLVDASPNKLEEICSVLENYRSTFVKSSAHSRLISQTLGNAYYRLARDRGKGTAVSDDFWGYIEKAGNEYHSVLPWYEGKKGLAKTLRLQANKYHTQQRQSEALACYKQIAALEEKFNVNLRSDGDKTRMNEYEDRGITETDPSETGRLATELYFYD